ncbi:retroviral-like aspartic protease family protein [Nannocystis pusilla]|uniref:Aspartyl protease family protein n=1 Tax=Nannocystis pusilla TaxID=889268 RepID=A0ABS7TIW9_9BACT|nr:retroviral-like aspartic protease family protein [Nannocystis pusilla]MBZ5708159.1 aspartyl protease family protein [Nannocystis pusilla]
MKRRSGPSLFISLAGVLASGGCAPRTGGETAPAASPACAAPDGERLALQRGDGSSPIVTVTVDGAGPFHLVLDTAASGTTLDADAVKRANLPRDTAMEQAEGIGGSVEVRLRKVAAVDAGPLRLRDATIAELPAPEFESHRVSGLGGIDLFGDRLAVWDLAGMSVSVSPSGALSGAAPCWRPLEVDWMRPWKVLAPITLNGRNGYALIDTGMQQTILNPVFAAALGLGAGDAALPVDGEITGIDGRPTPLLLARIGDARVGAWRWTDQPVHVADLPVFQRLGDPEAPLAVLGMDWLRGKRFAIDYGQKKVWQAPD